MSLIRISILNWEKFNPRSDRNNYSWFRFQNGFFHDQEVFGLGNLEKLLFIFVCCEASKKNSGQVELRHDYVCAILGLSKRALLPAIESLARAQLVEITEVSTQATPPIGKRQNPKRPTKRRHDDGKQPSLGCTTIRDETDDTNVTNETEESTERNEPHELVAAFKPFDTDGKLQLTFIERDVPLKTQQAFLDAYPDPKWVAQQVFKAIAWEMMNPQKRKKNFARFLGNWLSRGWDEHTSKFPSNPPRGGRGFQRPAGGHERGDDLGAMIEQVKTETFTETEGCLGGLNAAVG